MRKGSPVIDDIADAIGDILAKCSLKVILVVLIIIAAIIGYIVYDYSNTVTTATVTICEKGPVNTDGDVSNHVYTRDQAGVIRNLNTPGDGVLYGQLQKNAVYNVQITGWHMSSIYPKITTATPINAAPAACTPDVVTADS